MNEAQRQQLLRQFRGLQTDISLAITTETTRFERELYPLNIVDQQRTLVKLQRNLAVRYVNGFRVTRDERGSVRRDPMYDIELEFSDDGNGYGNPLVNPTANDEYYIRCRLRQHQAFPLLQGFELTWSKPTGWSWVDDIGAYTYDEAVSNPTIVTRVARAPSSNRGGKFRVVVARKFA